MKIWYGYVKQTKLHCWAKVCAQCKNLEPKIGFYETSQSVVGTTDIIREVAGVGTGSSESEQDFDYG